MNLLNLFAIAHQQSPDKVALRFRRDSPQDGSDPNQEAALTYAELFERAKRLAAALQARGLQRGDRVAFYLSNRPEFVVAYLALLHAGAVLVPINLRYRRREITHILHDSEPRLLIAERAQQAILNEVDAVGELDDVLWAEEIDAWQGEAADWQPVAVGGDELAMILYTSGTTGQSKGAMISHNNVIATVTGLLAAWAWRADDRLLLCLPLFHTHGFIVGLHCALAAGATTLLREKFDLRSTTEDLLAVDSPADALDTAPTLFFAVPTIYVRLVDELRRRSEAGDVDLSHMRLFCSGSAPLAAETHADFEALTGHQILERYGMTETGMNFSNLYAGPRVPGSVGVPLPGVSARIVKPTGGDSLVDVEPGQEGELLVRGSNVFGGYWRAPEKTAASFTHEQVDGAPGQRWFHTGDLAQQDSTTGYVTLLGRRHELIISGGFNIYPREIEELLVTYPGVAEAAVVGAPHAEWGEVPVAHLVCSEQVDEEALVDYCKGQLASFKVPRTFHRVESLPRNAMGKLQKHLLKRD